MQKRLQWLLILISLICSMDIFAAPNYQKDPCTSIDGFWTGDFKDLKKNCVCTTYYQVYQSQENAAFDLMQFTCSGDCNTPPDFQGFCRGAYFKSTNVDGFAGSVGENMMILNTENYTLKLYR